MQKDLSLTLHRFEILDSTNAKAKELARGGADSGTVVVALQQTAGRGRGTNRWHSPRGGLYYSILLPPTAERPPTDLPILAGVALVQAVKELLPKSHEVGLKWPNDCLLDGKKVGGVLCEALGEDAKHLCVVGIGLNVNTSASELVAFGANAFSATSFSVESAGGQFEMERIVHTLTAKLTELYALYRRDGFANIRYLWERNCPFLGKKVCIQEASSAITGTFEGIDDSGGLVLSTSDGGQRCFLTGEMSCSWLST